MSLDRRTAAMVEADLYSWRLYEEIAEHGIVEVAQRRPYWMPLGIKRYRVPQPVLDALTALEADERYRRAVTVCRAIRAAAEHLSPQEHACLWLLYWHGREIIEVGAALGVGRRRVYQLRSRIIEVVWRELVRAEVEPYHSEPRTA